MTSPVETKLILASASPRRRELLTLAGWVFEVRPADIDEIVRDGEDPAQYVQRLAVEKALAVGTKSGDGIVVAADTTVALGSRILGKPAEADEARAMLIALRGRDHSVFTGIAVYRAEDEHLTSDVCETRVPMRAYNEDEIDAYIATGDPFDEAGGYAIQHAGFHPVEGLNGCYANVVGLPLCHLAHLLAGLDGAPPPKGGLNCMAQLTYNCDLEPEVFKEGE
jgi:MAF protein